MTQRVRLIQIRKSKFYEASFDYENTYTNNEEPPVKKPLIDETWCNVSVKNIINYEDEEVVSEAEAEEEVVSEAEDLDEAESEEEAVSEAEDETVSLEDIRAEVEEEILSLIPPNEIDTIEEEDNIDSLNNYRLNYSSDHKYLTN